MFMKSILVSSAMLLAASLQVSAHAFIDPGLGVGGKGARTDVQRPSTATPCGKASLAAIDTSTAVAAANGVFAASITDFNAGTDGGRQVTATVNTDGTGKTFVAATVLTNGDANPTTVGTQPLSIQLPAGTACTGGASKDKCLVSLKTNGGFGNCVVVSTGAAAAAGSASAATGAAANGTAAASTGAATAGTAGAAVAGTAGAAAAAGAVAKQHKHKGAAGAAGAAGAKAAGAKAAGAKAAGAKAATGAAAAKGAKAATARNARSLVDNVSNNVNVVRRWIWAA